MFQFSFEQIKAFVAVAEQGSFSKAAKSLRKDRSTLHQQIGNLEIDLGIELFDRSGKFPVLTYEGQSLLTQAKHILYQAQSLQNSSDSLAEGNEQALTIIHDASVPISVIQQVHKQVGSVFPHTQLNWIHRGRTEAVEALLNKEADLAIVLSGRGTIPQKGLWFTNLGYMKFNFYAHQHSALGQKSSCSVTDLEQHTQYVAENYLEVDLGKKIVLSFQQSIVSNMDVLIALLNSGGWSILPEHIVSALPKSFGIKKLDIDFMNTEGRWSFVLLSRSQQSIGRVHSEVVKNLKQAFVSD